MIMKFKLYKEGEEVRIDQVWGILYRRLLDTWRISSKTIVGVSREEKHLWIHTERTKVIELIWYLDWERKL